MIINAFLLAVLVGSLVLMTVIVKRLQKA